MIFSIAELIEVISASVTLQPGDIIATGTPAGNFELLSFLKLNEYIILSAHHKIISDKIH